MYSDFPYLMFPISPEASDTGEILGPVLISHHLVILFWSKLNFCFKKGGPQ